MSIDYTEDIVMPYKKKKQKHGKKSDHKHEYQDCLIKWGRSISVGKICSVCRKLVVVKFFETERNENGYYKMLNDREVLNKYPDLDIYEYDTGNLIERENLNC